MIGCFVEWGKKPAYKGTVGKIETSAVMNQLIASMSPIPLSHGLPTQTTTLKWAKPTYSMTTLCCLTFLHLKTFLASIQPPALASKVVTNLPHPSRKPILATTTTCRFHFRPYKTCLTLWKESPRRKVAVRSSRIQRKIAAKWSFIDQTIRKTVILVHINGIQWFSVINNLISRILLKLTKESMGLYIWGRKRCT